MQNPQLIPAEFIHVVGEHVCLKIRIPKPQVPDSNRAENKIQDLHVMFCADKSGSMAGGPMRDSKGALLSLITKFRKAEVPITVYPFCDTFEEFSSDDIGYERLYNRCDQLKAGGRTLFKPVIEAQLNRILQKSYPNVFIVWLSDGDDNQGLQNLIPTLERFAMELEEAGTSCAVHTIGFSGDHDADLLNKLSQSGTRNGTFQYVPRGGRIPVAVNNVYELAFEVSAWGKLFAQGGEVVKRLIIEEVDECYIGSIYISEEEMEDCRLELHAGDQVLMYELELQRAEMRNLKELIFSVTSFISVKAKECLQNQGNRRVVDVLLENRPLFEEMLRRIQELRNSTLPLRALQRKQLEPFLEGAFEFMQKYQEVVSQLSPGGPDLENLQLAELMTLANKILLKRSLEKKIINKANQNFIDLNQAEDTIDQIKSEINPEEIQGQHEATAHEAGVCALSNKNWLQAYLEGDCLCATFEFERPKGGLADPNLFEAKNTYNTLLTAETFFNSKLFLGKAGQIIEGNTRFVQDAPTQSADTLEPKLPAEKINAILPLYINSEHWKISSLRLKPLLGWLITVDVLGYQQGFIEVLPFKMLVKAYVDVKDEQSSRTFDLIKETVLQIYRENAHLILPNLQAVLPKYINEPRIRLPTSIPDNEVFLAQLFCAITHGDIEGKYANIFSRLFEEETRRSLPERGSRQDLLKILGIDLDELYQMLSVQQIYDDLRRSATGEPVDKIEDSFTFTDRIAAFPDSALEIIDLCHQRMNNSESSLFRVCKMFELFGENRYTAISDSGLTGNEQFLGFLYQAIQQKEDKKRLGAIEEGNFVDVFDEQAAVQYIQSMYTNTVKFELAAYRRKASAQLSDVNDLQANAFALAEDLEQAASQLKGIKQGTSMFNSFIRKLQLPNIPHVIEKLRMLEQGQFNGTKLIYDKVKDSEFVTWRPSKKNFYRIWNANYSKGTLEDWISVAPGLEDYVQRINRRRNGERLPYEHPRRNCRDPRHNWQNVRRQNQAQHH